MAKTEDLPASRIRQERRRQLIEATIESIAKRGFAETTLSAVTAEAGLSHGVVNFHFESKEQLLIDTLGFLAEEHFDHWRRAMEKAGEAPAKRMEALVRADFAPAVCSRKKLAVWFAFWGQAKHRPIYLDIHSRHDAARRENLVALCSALGPAAGVGAAPERTATLIEAVIDGLWLQMMLDPEALDRREALAAALAQLAALYPDHFQTPPASIDR